MEKQLRAITIIEYGKWYSDNCKNECDGCIFENVNCNPFYPDCWIYHIDLYSKKFLKRKIKVKVKIPKLNEVEKSILKHNEENYRYIARDKLGKLVLCYEKPFKAPTVWLAKGRIKELDFNNKLFKFIKWYDEEPYLIKDLLKEQ